MMEEEDYEMAPGHDTFANGQHGHDMEGPDSEDADDLEQQGEAVYEEDSGTDEEEERRQFGIHQCLPVDDQEPDFDSGEPTTAEEYLRRVRWEAARLAPVVVSSVDPSQFGEQRTGGAVPEAAAADVPQCPPELQPSLAWLRAFLSQFARLRRQLQRECEMESGQVGQSHPAQPASGSPSCLMPELFHLRGLDQVELVQRAGAHLRRVARGEGLSPQDATWLYAYSARIEKPLHADMCALYRALLRHCARLRAAAAGPQDPLLPHLNILIAIAGCYFGQDETLATAWEEVEEEED